MLECGVCVSVTLTMVGLYWNIFLVQKQTTKLTMGQKKYFIICFSLNLPNKWCIISYLPLEGVV